MLKLFHGILLFFVCGVIVGVPAAFAQDDQPPIEILFPTTAKISVSTPNHYLIGRVDTTRIAKLELSSYLEKDESLDIERPAFPKDFARLVRGFFKDDFKITYIETRQKYRDRSREDRVLSAVFPEEERFDLKKFWDSKKFRKIYSSVIRDTNTVAIKVLVRGNKITELDLRNPEHLGRFKDIFILRLTLHPGMNQLRLRAFDQDEEIPREFPFSYIFKYELDKKTEVPPDFQTIRFHDGGDEKSCAKCHRMTLSKKEMAGKSAVAKSCYPCHKRITEAKFVHGPVSTWNCLACHNAAKNDLHDGQGFATRADTTEDLCFQCHLAMKRECDTKAFIHGPVASGKCDLCHSPHGSEYRGQIWMSVFDLCTTCHGDKYRDNHPVLNHPVRGAPDPLHPKRELSCVSCHSPHYSDSSRLFYSAQGLFELCQECHNK